MKRRAATILLFLLLGTVVNVAVAWGCAIWIVPRAGAGISDFRFRVDSLRHPVWESSVWARTGAHRIESTYLPNVPAGMSPEQLREHYAAIWGPACVEGAGPSWSRTSGRPEDDADVTQTWLAEDARGWPCLALRCTVQLDQFGGPNAYSVDGGIDLGSRPPRWGVLDQIAIPATPIWRGFTINTMVYAALLWVTVGGPFALRRHFRKRRGRCIKCGYDLRGDLAAGCPECGWGREEAEA